MTEQQLDRGVSTGLRRVAIVIACSVGILLCACSSAGSSTGVLKGTASPCAGVGTYRTAHAWEINVTLRHGSTVVSTKKVIDTQAANAPIIHQVFVFTEPPGSYTVSESPPSGKPVVIKAGATSTIALVDSCK
jgi:hypothetical protein